MGTQLSAKAAASVQRRVHLYETVVVATFPVPLAGVGTDTLEMVKVPNGATISDVLMAATDLDTDTAILLECGDGGDTDRFILSSDIGQAGGVARLDNPVGAAYQYTSNDTIDILVATGAGTEAAGTLTLIARYTIDP